MITIIWPGTRCAFTTLIDGIFDNIAKNDILSRVLK